MLYDPKWERQADLSTARGVLIAARKQIENEENWLNRCPLNCDEANGKRCAARAIWSLGSSAGGKAYCLLAKAMGVIAVPAFNDTHTHAEVLAAFDRAIEAA